MAMANDSVTTANKALEGLVKCPICLDYYKDPRILPCSHTFCYQCIKNLCKEGISQCPMRDSTIIIRCNIDRLPVNRTAKDLVEHIVESQHQKPFLATVPMCEHCRQILSEYLCQTCSKHYCTICLKKEHDINKFETHEIEILIADKTDILCSEHVEEKRKYWCTQCEELVCSDCLLYKHKQHTFIPLQDIVEETKTKLNSSMQQLLSMKENLQKLFHATQTTYRTHYQTHVKAKKDIEEFITTLQALLEKRKQSLMTDIRRNDAAQQRIIQEQQNNIVEQLKVVRIRELLTKQLYNAEDHFQLVKMKDELIIYNELIQEQYEHLMEGCILNVGSFIADDNLSQMKEQLENLGGISVETFLTDSRNIHPLLKLYQSSDSENYIPLDGNHAYGYRFQLAAPLKIQAVRVKSTLSESNLNVYILDYNDILVQTEIIYINHRNSHILKWLTIPVTCEIQNNYYIFVWAKPKERKTPLIACRDSNQSLRKINQNVSVRCKRAIMETSMSFDIGAKFNVIYDAFLNNDDATEASVSSIKMILDL